jgi:glycosyltransferase involved in cell wall biosynthesis
VKSPLISVIIPNYNYGRYLADAIESVLNQTYKNIQLIVVDNGSTDNSVIVASNYSGRLTLLEKEHGGVSSARNFGLLHAMGEYICFLDSDDTWTPNKLESQLETMIATQADVVYSGINICDTTLNVHERVSPIYRGHCEDLYFKYPSKAIVLLGCSNALIRREIIQIVGEFKLYLHFSADWDYFRRISKFARIEFVPLYQVNYRKHGDNMSSSSVEEYYRDNERAIRDFIGEMRTGVPPAKSTHHRISLWLRFQFQAIKTLIRANNFSGALKSTFKMLAELPSI